MARSPMAALVLFNALYASVPAATASMPKRSPGLESPSSPANRTQASLSLGTSTSVLGNLRSAIPTMGGEVTLDAGPALDAGGFYDRSGPLSVYGAVARYSPGFGQGLFVDAKVGIAAESALAEKDRLGLGAGVGVGYRIRLGDLASVSPRAGLRYAPSSPSAAGPVDLGVMFSFRL